MLFLISNVDLLTVAIAVAGILLLGFLVYFGQPKSITAKTFLLFALVTSIWGIVNYAYYQVSELETSLWLLRSIFVSALFQAFSIYLLFYVFPETKKNIKNWKVVFPGVSTIVAAGLIFTPLVISGISPDELSGIPNAHIEPGILVFGIVSVGLVLSTLWILIKRLFTTPKGERRPFWLLLTGVLLMFGFIIAFNFIAPAFFNNRDFIPLGALFVLPFVILSALAVAKYRIFDVKVLTVGLLTFSLSLISVGEVILAESLIRVLVNIGQFIAVLVFGIWLIRSVSREVQQREKIEVLAKDLKVANERLKELDRQKSEFVSIASHQLRSPITAIRGYISLILEKEFGDYPSTLKEPLDRIAESARLMIKSIEDYLNISRIEQGRMKYEMSAFDVSNLTKTVVDEYLPIATKKGLDLTFSGSQKIQVNADIGKIKQVIANLVDNSIKYTPSGNVTVKATMFEGKARVTVSDTGVGLAKEDIGDLFNKFIRARGANKINTSGTGLGLYVAKQMIEAHKGKIWAESEGKSKGSRFIFELPLSS